MDKMTKEGFWADIAREYPEQMADFQVWLSEYRRREGWDELFNNGRSCNATMDKYATAQTASDFGPDAGIRSFDHQVKFHNLPNAMQIGIFMQYTIEHGGVDLFDAVYFMEVAIRAIPKWFKAEKEFSKV